MQGLTCSHAPRAASPARRRRVPSRPGPPRMCFRRSNRGVCANVGFVVRRVAEGGGAPLPEIPQSASGAGGSSSPLGGRKPAGRCGRPLPSSEERRLQNFVRRRLAPPAPPPPLTRPPAGPFVEAGKGAPEAGEGGGPRGARRRPPGNRLRSRHTGSSSPVEGRRAGPAAPRLSRPGCRRAGNFVPGDEVFSAPGSAPARSRRPPQAGLRGTWRPGSPDRAPRQSAPAPRSLPAGSSRAGTRLAWSGAPGADGACREPGASMDAWCCHGPVYSD
ncbi:uncharacterized protein LOC113898746 [Bos indicus x Bos taurus]|uniref:uncharacterized protein LOC113898746 n=1 Tax=Bos indicus x Bos taurus TaxID=30522 RepID=UPI000F7D4171|nr:uncharacterized protein LOC113898746 [Bos indicus x Bos taurus]